MIRSLYLILTTYDEELFSTNLSQTLPELAFVNGTRWESESPPLVSSISEASADRVLLWDRSLFPSLPCIRDAHGSVIGPSTRYVISLDKTSLARNYQEKEVLVSGALSWSAGNPSSAETKFYRTVWRIARKCAPTKVKVVSGDVATGFLAAEGAVRWWSENPDSRYFGLNAVEMLATPAVEPT